MLASNVYGETFENTLCHNYGMNYQKIQLDLTQHNETIKSNLVIKPLMKLPCPVCGEHFTCIDSCAYHILVSHFRNGMLPANQFHCHLCYKSFSSETELTLHLFSHTNSNISSGSCELPKFDRDLQTIYGETNINTGINPQAGKIFEWLLASQNQQVNIQPFCAFLQDPILDLGSQNRSVDGNLILPPQMLSETEYIGKEIGSSDVADSSPVSQSPQGSSRQVGSPTSKIYKCGHCLYASSRNDHLKSHMRVHTNEKPYKCKHCPYVTAHSGNLYAHIRSHNGEKPFKCDYCPYATAYRSHIKSHTRIHTGEKPYKCDECPYASSCKRTLQVHVRVHNGEKPYKCKQCSYATSACSNLKAHMIHHTTELKFKCSKCSFSCNEYHRLNIHISNYHE